MLHILTKNEKKQTKIWKFRTIPFGHDAVPLEIKQKIIGVL